MEEKETALEEILMDTDDEKYQSILTDVSSWGGIKAEHITHEVPHTQTNPQSQPIFAAMTQDYLDKTKTCIAQLPNGDIDIGSSTKGMTVFDRKTRRDYSLPGSMSHKVADLPPRANLPHCDKEAPENRYQCLETSSGGLQEILDGKGGAIQPDVKSDRITLPLSPFCGNGEKGSVRAKDVVVAAFMHGDGAENEAWFRVRLYDNTTINHKEVEREENGKGFILTEYYDLEVHNANSDVTVELTTISGTWTVTGDNQRVIAHTKIWRKSEEDRVKTFPSLLFHVKQTSPYEDCPFNAAIHVFQDGREKHGLQLFAQKPSGIKPQGPPWGVGNQEALVMNRPYFVEGLPLDYDTTAKLCKTLDPGSDKALTNWRNLPESLMEQGNSSFVTEIEWEAKLLNQSPTRLVLAEFVRGAKAKGDEYLLGRLREALSEMKDARRDLDPIIKAIDKHMETTGRNRKDSCDYSSNVEDQKGILPGTELVENRGFGDMK